MLPENQPSPLFSGEVTDVVRRVQGVLTPDLLTPKWRALAELSGHPHYGQCYVAAEAVYHLLGGRSRWNSCVLSHKSWPEGMKEGNTHWFLREKSTGLVMDPTAGQFSYPVDYSRGVNCAFMTQRPSKRARKVLGLIS